MVCREDTLYMNNGKDNYIEYYKEDICKHLKFLFPRQVSYNRFVELEKEVLLPLIIFIKKVLLGTCTGISFVDSIETVNDELKNIGQIEHSRYRFFNNFIANSLSAIAAYCFFEKKPAIEVNFINDGQLTIF